MQTILSYGMGGRIHGHLTAVIDGVLYDTHDCSWRDTRCVYGYFSRP
jgi:hypothetical protein